MDDRYAALTRRLYAALAEGDREELADVLHADFVGRTTEGLPLGLGGVYRGPATMRKEFWGRIGRDYRVEARPEGFHLLDDGRLHVRGRYHGEARVSGKPLDAVFIHLISFAQGRIVGLEQLTDSAAWNESLAAPDALETIDYRVEDGVAHLRLDRPEQRNAIDLRMGEETLVVARRIAADRSVRAVLISGSGPALTVGGDIDYFERSQAQEFGELLGRMTTPFHEAFRVLSRIDAPIITAAHGAVAGGGLGYVYAADIVLASEKTKFVTAFADLGVSGDGGGTWHLPRLVGARRAALMYLQSTPIDAERALEWGLVSEVVPDEELQDRALALARKLASGPTRAFGRMRELLRDSWTNTLSEQLLAETEGVMATGDTEDSVNAVAAFIGKKSPRFKGR